MLLICPLPREGVMPFLRRFYLLVFFMTVRSSSYNRIEARFVINNSTNIYHKYIIYIDLSFYKDKCGISFDCMVVTATYAISA